MLGYSSFDAELGPAPRCTGVPKPVRSTLTRQSSKSVRASPPGSSGRREEKYTVLPSGEKNVSTSEYVPENGATTGSLQPLFVAKDISTVSCSPAKKLPTVHIAIVRS